MRNLARINSELTLLVRIYGSQRVVWAPNYSWIEIKDFRLPRGLNRTTSDIMILIPDGYGYSVPPTELYVDPELRIWHDGTWQEIPHYFNGYSPNSSANKKGWRYPCLHPLRWGPSSSILTYLGQIFLYLSNPWKWG